MTARIGLTFVPILLLGNMKGKHILKRVEKSDHPKAEEKKEAVLRGIKQRTIIFHILIFIPIVLYWATIFASLERTPLTGRCVLVSALLHVPIPQKHQTRPATPMCAAMDVPQPVERLDI